MYIRANNTLSHTNTHSLCSPSFSSHVPGTTSTQRIAVAACQSHEQLSHMSGLRAHRAGVRIVTGAAATFLASLPALYRPQEGKASGMRAEPRAPLSRNGGEGGKGTRGFLCAEHRGFNEEHKKCAAVLRPGRQARLLAPLRLRAPRSRTILLCACRGLLPAPPHRLFPEIRSCTAC
jgi:hypothetical protein